MTPTIFQQPLSYADQLDDRRTDCIDLVVIHCTELPDLATARVWGEKVIYPESNTGNSGHFYIDRDGRIEQWVPLDRVAHHTRGYNAKSIGVELVNTGRYPDWYQSGHQQMTEPYPVVQIDSLVHLLNELVTELPGLTRVAGHEALDTDLQPALDDPGVLIRRKMDPGPLFPWQDLLSKTLLTRFSNNSSN